MRPGHADPRLPLTSYVPPWQIDANAHWNTQFYLDAFRSAAAVAGAEGGDGPRVEHVRFFRELRTLETLTVHSATVAAADYRIAHLMRLGTSGVLCACAYSDRPPASTAALPMLAADLAARTAPRGLPSGQHGGTDVARLLVAGRASVTHVGVLRGADVDHSGRLTAQGMQGRVSDGTGHLWAFLGVPQSAFYDNGLGRAIVELKITRHGGAEAGQTVRLISWLEALGSRGFHLRHRLEGLLCGTLLADLSSMTLLLDLEARKSAAMPDTMRNRLAPLAAGGS